MIIDLKRFIKEEQPFWDELDALLRRMQDDAGFKLDMDGIRRFHYLYHRTSSSLAKLSGFSARQELKTYLESLVGRSFAQIHEHRKKPDKLRLFKWFFIRFPRTFRAHARAFLISVMIMAAGIVFGAAALAVDKDAKTVLMPFSHLMQDPDQRVAREETRTGDHLEGHKSSFASSLMTNNIRVSILAMGLGMSFGIGTLIVLFANGVFLGATCMDYILAGQSTFLTGWLLPHGSIEIPAILLAGQAGLVLAFALIGWGRPISLKTRLKKVMPDLVTLIGGVSIMLIWAGFIEAFLSQYHEPVISYQTKIGFGGFNCYCSPYFYSGQEPVRQGIMEFKTDTLKISTPEGVVFNLRLAGPVTRFLAWLLDFFCIMAMHQLLNNLLRVLNIISPDVYQAMAFILFFIISIGYAIVMEWFFGGQTFGKRLFRLRVMDAQGLRLTFSQVVIRNLMRFVDVLPFLYMVGGMSMMMSRQNARVGDIAGSTVVVREEIKRKPDVKQVLPDKFNSLKEFPHLCARLRQKTSQTEADIALNALFRRQTLDPIERVRVFEALEIYFKAKVAFPDEALEGGSPEQFVRNVVDVLYQTVK